MTRIEAIKEYLFEIVKEIDNSIKEINADMLSKNINNYSLDRIPTDNEVNKWITGGGIYREVYLFRSRKAYSEKSADNLKNIGFYEKFEEIIKQKNKNKIFPEIPGASSIKCLNPGTMAVQQQATAEFNIQIQIEYEKN